MMTALEALYILRDEIEIVQGGVITERDQYVLENCGLQAHTYDMRATGLGEAIIVINRMINELKKNNNLFVPSNITPTQDGEGQ